MKPKTHHQRACVSRTTFWGGVAATLLVTVSWVWADAALADDFDTRYFEQLRSRGLFTLAESLCRRRLQADALPAAERLQVSIELARTFAAHARSQSESDERRELWNAAKVTLNVARDATTETEQRVELAVQDSIISCDQAEFDGLLAELNPYDQRQQTDVAALRDRVLRQLEQLETALQELLSRPSASKPLTLARYRALQKGVLYQSGELLIAQGRAFGRGTPERSAAFLQAEQKLKRVASTTTDDRIVWLSQVSLARLMRLKLETDRAAALLAAIERDEPPPDILDEVVAERVELYATTKREPDAADLLRTYRRQQPQFPSRLAFLAVRTWLDLSRAALVSRHAELAAELQVEARRAIEHEPSLVAGYWAHRARLHWDQCEESERLGDRLAALLQEARGRYAAGETTDALTAFGRAFDEAVEQDSKELSFEIGLTLARLQLEQRQVDEALRLLERLLKLHAEHKRVAELDLLRAICVGRRFQTNPTKPLREAYEAALAEHVERYAASPTSADAAWMAAQLKEKLSQFEAALRFYAHIPAEHARETEALAAVARCYRRLSEHSRSGANRAEQQRDWSREALPKLTPFAEQLVEKSELSEPHIEFLSQTAFMAVTNPEYLPESGRWTKRLSQWLAAAADDEGQVKLVAQYRKSILSLKVLLVCRQSSAIESRRVVEELKAVPTTDRMSLLKSLEAAVQHLSQAERRALATIMIGALEHAALDAPQPSLMTQVEIERLLAAAYGAIGDAANAKAALRRMERLKP